jgi:hypothetical protein
MYERPADDPTPGVIESVRLEMRSFRRAHNDGEELPMQRRRLLQVLLASAGVITMESLLGPVSAHATAMEYNESGEALAETSRILHEVCMQGMMGTPIEQSMQRSLACWRDALAIKVNVTGPRHMRAAEMESKAACLMAQFHGDLGDEGLAARWYTRALAVAPVNDLKAWIYSCSAWVPMFNGDGEGTVKAAENALGFTTMSNPIQEAFAFNQLARGYAIQGDRESALKAIHDADRAFNRYGYYGKNTAPSFDSFTKWQHAAYAVNTYSMLGEVEMSRAARAVLRDVPFMSDINKMLHDTSEAVCLIHEGEPVGAVELVQRSIDSMPVEAASTAVVQGRAKMFVDQMPTKMREAREVRDFREGLVAA